MRILLLATVIIANFGFAQIGNKLILGFCDTIPNDLYERTNLKTLIIENGPGYCLSPEKVLSSEIRNLKALETLFFSSYGASTKLPVEIKYLKNLTHLTTSDILVEVSELYDLEMLSMMINNSEELDDLKNVSFENLKNLEYLSIRFNDNLDGISTKDLFKNIDGLKSLKELVLYNVNEAILAQIPSFKSLESLTINGLKGKFSQSFTKFPNLLSLVITRAPDLTKIPLSIYELKELKQLSITSSGLVSVPQGISSLTNLKKLDLTFNKIVFLAPDIVDLTQMETLSLVRNFNLLALPEAIGKLSSLKRLSVESCQLTSLPESIVNLSNLKVLSFKANNIKELPEDWSKLNQLKRLNAERNRIEIIPSSLLKIGSLEYLHFGHNNLSGYNFKSKKQQVIGLQKLKQLDLQHNDLEELPFDLGTLKNLEDLSIYNNKIKSLPVSIGKLKELTSLSMSHNKIRQLPVEMKKLQIYEFSLHNNSFSNRHDFVDNFPKVSRAWVDEKFKLSLDKHSKIAKEVFFR